MNSPNLRDEQEDRRGGIWDYVSPSRINAWLRCPLAFRLRYVDGIVSPPSVSQFVGKTVHRGLENFYRQRQQRVLLSAAEITAHLRNQWDGSVVAEGVRFASSAAEQVARQQSLQLVEAYLDQVPFDEPRPMGVETRLEAPLRDPVSGENFGLSLVGVLDLVLPGPAGPVIRDFKTTSRGGECLEITHELQLSAYSYLHRENFSVPEEGLEIHNLVKTKLPRVENHRFAPRTQAHYLRLFAIIRAYLDSLDSGTYVIRPNHLCGACEFSRTRCAQWTG